MFILNKQAKAILVLLNEEANVNMSLVVIRAIRTLPPHRAPRPAGAVGQGGVHRLVTSCSQLPFEIIVLELIAPT